jgi:UDP-N-acetylmuramoyl-tripeptide--D-alanyl-D-alanine ligase
MIRGLISLYSWRYPAGLVALWREHPELSVYLNHYWQMGDFAKLSFLPDTDLSAKERFTRNVLYVWMGFQIGLAALLGWAWYYHDLLGGWQFALATLLSYPLLLAYVQPLARGLWMLGQPKALGRAVVCAILERQVKRLRSRNSFKVVGVAGSVGKTSTKIAIARTLQATHRVQWQEGNYNDRVTIPLVFFGHDEPSLFNVFAWLKVFWKNARTIRHSYPYQFVVIELGTDHPGSTKEFAYLKPDLMIMTAVTHEHMEYFKTLDAVAEEELRTLDFSAVALVNIDDTPAQYLEGRSYSSYGTHHAADYAITERKRAHLRGQEVTFRLGKKAAFTLEIPLLGEHGAKIALAAAASGHLLGLPLDDIRKGVAEISAFAGRMQVLYGKQGSTIIDDTYNATPVAAKAALDVIYGGEAPQRIAILGSMNELGDYSPEAHRIVGEYCDPEKLDLVITIGEDAKEYLAPAAKERGCQVKTFLDPYKAGAFVRKQLQEGAVVLAKGSQNGVFAEEAIKALLLDKADEAKLVRQSAYWMSVKAKQFKS